MLTLQDLYFSLLETGASSSAYDFASYKRCEILDKLPQDTAKALSNTILVSERECFIMGFRQAIALVMSGEKKP